jgi:hypothetical protein
VCVGVVWGVMWICLVAPVWDFIFAVDFFVYLPTGIGDRDETIR